MVGSAAVRPRAAWPTIAAMGIGELIGLMFVGFLAGGISGWFVGTRSVQGCLPTIVLGIVGALIGGWLARELGYGSLGVFSGLVFAILGAVLVRLVLRALEGDRRR